MPKESMNVRVSPLKPFRKKCKIPSGVHKDVCDNTCTCEL